MADYAGAVAAIKSRLSTNWTTTRIVEPNVTPEEPWPPIDANGNPAAFVVIEVIGNSSEILGVAQNAAGDNMGIDFGLIRIHVLVPNGTGTATAYAYASTISALFRNVEFYNETSGFAVRTWRPRVDSGDSADVEGVLEGMYWRVSVTAEFEYIHID